MLTDEQFAHFKIIERLGYGGMATVYQAQDTLTDTIVALKILHDQYAADTEIIKRFSREADIFHRLQHPHIVPIINHGNADGKFYIVMQYMSGGTLFERFGYQKEVETEYTLTVLTQVASALDFAHEHGVIHRDLKLENILLDENDTAYLTDFGIAFLANATRLTSNRAVSGTPLYMSPEQGLSLDITKSSDIYSLAVMAYLMLTGYFPFTGHDPYTVINQHISNPPPLPTSVNPLLPTGVNQVMLRGLHKEPMARFPTATEFVNALKQTLIDDAERTQTMVRLNAPNPQAPKTADEFADTVIGGVQPASTTSHVSNNRILILGGFLIMVLLIGLIVAVVSNNSASLDSLAVAQTQVRQELEQDMTATGSISTAVISKPDDGLLISSPDRNREELGTIPYGETVTLVGRTGPGDFIEIETADGRRGFIKSDQLATTYHLLSLPITYRPENDPNQPPPNNNGNVDCSEPITTTPFGFIGGRGGAKLLAEPSRDAEVLMTVPQDRQVKLVARDENLSFIQIELNDSDETNGFVLIHEIRTNINLSCLPPLED